MSGRKKNRGRAATVVETAATRRRIDVHGHLRKADLPRLSARHGVYAESAPSCEQSLSPFGESWKSARLEHDLLLRSRGEVKI